MVLFFISIHIFAKRGLGSFAENIFFRKQDKFAYETEIWAVRACQFTEKRSSLRGAWDAVNLLVSKMFTQPF